MKKATTNLFGALAALAAMVAANASTGTDNLGKVTIGTDDFFAFGSTRPPASFMDTVKFDLNSLNAVVSDSFFDPNVKGLDVSLYNDTTKSLVFQCTSACAHSDTFSGLTEGDHYSLIFSGDTGKGSTNSAIFGTLSVAAVPEAGSLSMILAGVGLLVIYQWRRRGKASHQALSGTGVA
jgi:hypothetical protein